MTTSLATAIIPFPRAREAEVNRALDILGSGSSFANTRAILDAEGLVHFMSIVVVPADDDREAAHLIVETTSDAHPREALRRLAFSAHHPLQSVLQTIDGPVPLGQPPRMYPPEEIARLLVRHGRQFAPTWTRWNLGLQFAGTLDLTVRRIRREAALAEWIRQELAQMRPAPPLDMLGTLRARAFADPDLKWAFVTEPVQHVLEPRPAATPGSFFLGLGRKLLAPLAIAALVAGVLCWMEGRSITDGIVWAMAITVIMLATLLAICFAGVRKLRKQEADDVPFDVEPDAERMAQIQAREDVRGCMQNHLFGVSVMKPGWWRGLSLGLSFALIAHRAAHEKRPGFIDKIGTIHFARWLLLPGTDKLVFLSNYDGSWQSYLEDFIARLRDGLTSVWSNTRDFPRTENLASGGAGDGSRFKRWARRQQLPTRFWYSAYPKLGTARIRANAAVRHAFASARTEEEAAKFVALFGYAGRDALEVREIPALAFGGLGKLRFATALVVTLPPTPEQARTWLQGVQNTVTFTDRNPPRQALVLGFTSQGLRHLCEDEAALRTFPLAFQQGMAWPARLSMLGDQLGTWEWKPLEVDALLVAYAETQGLLDDRVRRLEAALTGRGGQVARRIPLQPLPLLPEELKEPFGFRDGVSQPLMRGTLRESREPDSLHLVQPGELVLGYRDNLGIVPPTPRLRGRDIGRNGTFLVVRELEQDVAGFDAQLQALARQLATDGDPRVPTSDPAALAEWLAAKMVGRWKDGSSLLRNPRESLQEALLMKAMQRTSAAGQANAAPAQPDTPDPRLDNRFLFGREDPDGLRCPFGAHIRRANPRDSFEPGSQVQIEISNRHRILRVGRPYSPDGREKPGLFFMCVNADLERQFEFLQQSWLNAPDFHDLDGEADPLMGCGQRRMTIPTPNGPLLLDPLASYVKPLGGAYFFMPSRSALALLAASPARASAKGSRPAAPPALAATTDAAGPGTH